VAAVLGILLVAALQAAAGPPGGDYNITPLSANAGSNGDPNTLFFTAGPDDESDGLFGTLTTG
jgi:hypothetical protein